jgi:hypothetical protein
MMVAADILNEVTCLFTLRTNNLVLTIVGGQPFGPLPARSIYMAGNVEYVAGKELKGSQP